MLVALPTVGREMERAELRRCAERAAAGHGALVLLGGEAGIGKSSLLESLLAESGLRYAIGRCPGPGEAPPYGPWLEVVGRLARATGLDQAALPPPFGRAEQEKGGPFMHALALEQWLAQAPQPILIAIEDVHWADGASLDLLRHFAARLRELQVLVVATYRSDEIHRTHPLWALLPDLQRSGAVRMVLDRLTASEVLELTRAALPGLEDPEAVAETLHSRTGGHALFVRDLLLSARRDGRILREGMPLPETVQQVIDARLNRLSDRAQTALQVAAVIGERFSYRILQGAAALTEEELLQAIEEALTLRVIRALDTADEEFAFDHALVREAILAGLIGPRRKRWHTRVAEALLAQAFVDTEAVALHLYRAGDVRAVSYLNEAALKASNLFLLAYAGECWERALELMPESDPRRAESLFRLSTNLSHIAPRRARACLEEALRAAEAHGHRTLAVRIRHYSVIPPNGYCESLTELDALAHAEESLLNEPDLFHPEYLWPWHERVNYAPILGPKVAALIGNGRLREARELLAHLRQAAQTQSSLPDPSFFHLAEGDTEELKRHLTRAVEESRRLGTVFWIFEALQDRSLFWVLFHAGHPDEVDRYTLEFAEYVLASDRKTSYPYLPPGFAATGIFEFFRGDWAAAHHNLVEYLISGDRPLGVVRFYAPFAVLLLVEMGNYGVAGMVAGQLQPARPGGEVFWSEGLLMHIVKGRLELRSGRMESARHWLEAGTAFLKGAPDHALQALHWSNWSELSLLARDLQGAHDYALRGIESAVLVNLPYGEIECRRLLGQALEARGRRGPAEEQMRAALELAERCRFGYEAARSRLALGALLGNRAMLEAAREAFGRLNAAPGLALAKEALSRLEAPARRADAPLPDGLTEREVEVIRLVTQGLTDREVGERLFISRRTVDGHLRNIFNKVGVGSRASLAAYAVTKGLL